MRWRIDAELFKNKRLYRRPSSLHILFGLVCIYAAAWAVGNETSKTA